MNELSDTNIALIVLAIVLVVGVVLWSKRDKLPKFLGGGGDVGKDKRKN